MTAGAGLACLALVISASLAAPAAANAQALTPGCFAGSRIHPCAKPFAFQPRKIVPRGPLTDALRRGPLDVASDPLGIERDRTGTKVPTVDEVRLPSQRPRDRAVEAAEAPVAE